MLFLQNDSLPSLCFMQLDIAVSCSSSVDCTASHIICEVVLRENSSLNAKDVVEDRTKCAAKEVELLLPTNGHGFGEESITDEIKGIAAYAVQQLENNGDAKRSVVDIMSIKRQVSTLGEGGLIVLNNPKPKDFWNPLTDLFLLTLSCILHCLFWNTSKFRKMK